MLRVASALKATAARAFAFMSPLSSGATTHEPLAAIENLTPVKTVPDELKQLPTKLPMIKTFDASSRCVLLFDLNLIVTGTLCRPVTRAYVQANNSSRCLAVHQMQKCPAIGSSSVLHVPITPLRFCHNTTGLKSAQHTDMYVRLPVHGLQAAQPIPVPCQQPPAPHQGSAQ